MTIKHIIEGILKKLGYRIFTQKGLDANFVYYNRWGIAPDSILRRFVRLNEIGICIDAGANRGQTAKSFAALFPNAKIYSFEPVKATYEKLACATRDMIRVVPVNLALGDIRGEMEMTVGEDDLRNSLAHLKEGAAHGSVQTVEVTTVDDFRAREGIQRIHFFKTDTEGFDLCVLRGAEETFREEKVDFVYCEVGFEPSDKEHTFFVDVLKHLSARGFLFLGLYDTAFANTPARIAYANALFGHKRTTLAIPWD